jgi:hypothetical protein
MTTSIIMRVLWKPMVIIMETVNIDGAVKLETISVDIITKEESSMTPTTRVRHNQNMTIDTASLDLIRRTPVLVSGRFYTFL